MIYFFPVLSEGERELVFAGNPDVAHRENNTKNMLLAGKILLYRH
jgi:hypothetical protein